MIEKMEVKFADPLTKTKAEITNKVLIALTANGSVPNVENEYGINNNKKTATHFLAAAKVILPLHSIAKTDAMMKQQKSF